MYSSENSTESFIYSGKTSGQIGGLFCKITQETKGKLLEKSLMGSKVSEKSNSPLWLASTSLGHHSLLKACCKLLVGVRIAKKHVV